MGQIVTAQKLNVVDYKILREYLTGKPNSLFQDGYIGFHDDIRKDIVDEIGKLTTILNGYISKYHKVLDGTIIVIHRNYVTFYPVSFV